MLIYNSTKKDFPPTLSYIYLNFLPAMNLFIGCQSEIMFNYNLRSFHTGK